MLCRLIIHNTYYDQMGPKKGMTDEKKQEMFEQWQASPEYDCIRKFQEKRNEVPRLELSLKDVSWDIQPYLTAQFQMIQDLKVPGRKAKCMSILTFVYLKEQWGLHSPDD